MDNEEENEAAAAADAALATVVEEELLRQHAEEDDKLRTIGLFGEVNSTKLYGKLRPQLIHSFSLSNTLRKIYIVSFVFGLKPTL